MIDINLIGMGTKEIAKDESNRKRRKNNKGKKKYAKRVPFFLQKIMFSHLKLYGFFKMNIDVA